MISLTPTPHLDALLDLALAEDLGIGDATADTLIPPERTARMALIAREALVLCGVPVVERLLWRFGPGAPAIEWHAADGDAVDAGTVVGHLSGPLRTLLVLERTVLNFMQRMSGVATATRRYVDAVASTGAKVVDTRKTLPGYRLLDKYATRVGGASNHRSALDGGVLIKDNHLEAAGGVAAAVEQARARGPHSLRIEVEVEDLSGLEAALSAGAEVILLDNFTPAQVKQAAARVEAARAAGAAGRVLLEASGGITLDTVRAYAEAGVDLLAIGALTHSVRAVDLAAEID